MSIERSEIRRTHLECPQIQVFTHFHDFPGFECRHGGTLFQVGAAILELYVFLATHFKFNIISLQFEIARRLPGVPTDPIVHTFHYF